MARHPRERGCPGQERPPRRARGGRRRFCRRAAEALGATLGGGARLPTPAPKSAVIRDCGEAPSGRIPTGAASSPPARQRPTPAFSAQVQKEPRPAQARVGIGPAHRRGVGEGRGLLGSGSAAFASFLVGVAVVVASASPRLACTCSRVPRLSLRSLDHEERGPPSRASSRAPPTFPSDRVGSRRRAACGPLWPPPPLWSPHRADGPQSPARASGRQPVSGGGRGAGLRCACEAGEGRARRPQGGEWRRFTLAGGGPWSPSGAAAAGAGEAGPGPAPAEGGGSGGACEAGREREGGSEMLSRKKARGELSKPGEMQGKYVIKETSPLLRSEFRPWGGGAAGRGSGWGGWKQRATPSPLLPLHSCAAPFCSQEASGAGAAQGCVKQGVPRAANDALRAVAARGLPCAGLAPLFLLRKGFGGEHDGDV